MPYISTIPHLNNPFTISDKPALNVCCSILLFQKEQCLYSFNYLFTQIYKTQLYYPTNPSDFLIVPSLLWRYVYKTQLFYCLSSPTTLEYDNPAYPFLTKPSQSYAVCPVQCLSFEASLLKMAASFVKAEHFFYNFDGIA